MPQEQVGDIEFLIPNTEIRYHFPHVIDSTILTVLSSCWRKVFHEHILGLSSHETSVDLHAGAAFARGVEVVRRNYWFDRLKPEDAIHQGFQSFIMAWGDYEAPEGHAKDFINTAGAFFDYWRQYPIDKDPIQPYMMAGDRPAIEFTFAIPLPIKHPITGDPILWGGRTDMIGYYEKFLAIIDEKTTKQLGMNWERKWSMRGQFLGYHWAAQEHGIPTQASVIRGIAIQKTQYSHLQAIVQAPRWLIDQWKESMLIKVREFVRRFALWHNLVQKGETPIEEPWLQSFGDACESYGGCQFQDLCLSQDPYPWYGTYKRRVWNPLNRNPTDA